MSRVAAIVWVMLGTVLAGSGVVAVLCTPSLAAMAMSLMAPVGVAGYVIAVPLAIMVAKTITAPPRQQ
jgi:Mg2+/Co2+ transporter CorB